jgi:hypothetical protein
MAPWRRPPREVTYVADPMTGYQAEVRHVMPANAQKAYRCPGCNQDVAPRTGHVVIVPLSDPSLRRHWHSACWALRDRRHPRR